MRNAPRGCWVISARDGDRRRVLDASVHECGEGARDEPWPVRRPIACRGRQYDVESSACPETRRNRPTDGKAPSRGSEMRDVVQGCGDRPYRVEASGLEKCQARGAMVEHTR